MSDAMVQDRRPGDSEVRRRQRTKNLGGGRLPPGAGGDLLDPLHRAHGRAGMMRFDKNARIAWTLVAVVGGMLGMAYAAVPLYELFCKATGVGGTPIVVQEGERPVLSRTVTVRFAETLRGSLRGSR
jgi:hypothetical protein